MLYVKQHKVLLFKNFQICRVYFNGKPIMDKPFNFFRTVE
jgi:hypothetical protein